MNSNYLACLAGALLLGGSTFAAEQDVINQSFSVKPGGKLLMNVDRGSIHVATSNNGKVDIKVVRELKGGSDREAKEIYASHKINLNQDGDTVRIDVDRSAQKRGWFGNNPLNKLRVEYTISVPSEYNLELHTAGGNIDIADLTGTVLAQTAGGNLKLGAIQGPIDANTAGGNISVEGAKGKTSVRTAGGDLRLRNVDGELDAKTSGGSIAIDRVLGSVRAETSGGNIKVNDAHGAVYAHTSGGNVSAELLTQPKGSCTLKTSGGNVALTLAQNVAADVDARTSGGSIRSDFSGEMNKSRTKLAAQLNGGGPGILLETSGGNVELRKK